MDTLFITHPDCLKHDTGLGHPECAERLTAIEERLAVTHLLDYLTYRLPPLASDDHIRLAHTPEHIAEVTQQMPPEGHRHLDPDTRVTQGSERAARLAAGAVIHAVDEVIAKRADAAFCCVRPPGHHANSHASSGFCVFNSIAIGARYALQQPQISRVAVIDFDVHHGNGTEDIIVDDDNVLFCSIFQHPFYPNTPVRPITDAMVSVPLSSGSGSQDFRATVAQYWIPALHQFKPDMILISAGFDAHRDDDMGGLSLLDSDYAWVTLKLRELADQYCDGRIVSSLEGGYELKALARSVEQHVRVLSRLEGVI